MKLLEEETNTEEWETAMETYGDMKHVLLQRLIATDRNYAPNNAEGLLAVAAAVRAIVAIDESEFDEDDPIMDGDEE